MKPKGFWSYARGDDDHLDDMLTQLRAQIAGEVSMLMGHDVGIFQDIHDLRVGDKWEEKLREGVTAASFLIPVLTPRFFNREWCREEVLTYLDIAKDKGLEPRIFPIRFVPWDDDNDCEVRKALQPFQFKDFSNWRFESDPTQKSRMLNAFGKDVKAQLKLTPKPKKAAPKAKAAQPDKAARETQSSTAHNPSPDTGPQHKIYTVDPFPGRADFHKISDAIEAAEAGSRIVVREGTYRGSLYLSKPLEITGEGDRERVVVVCSKGNVLQCDALMARISGMRFRREKGGKNCGAWITAGAVEIDDCIFESLSLAAIEIRGPDATPTLRGCLIRDGAEVGLLVYGAARPMIETSRFVGNRFAGVAVMGEMTFATFRNCVAENGRNGGFYFHDKAGGRLDDCESVGNGNSGVHVTDAADLSVKNCTLRNNKEAGILVFKGGVGRFEGCEIRDNGMAGVAVQEGGKVSVSDSVVSGNGYEAVWIIDAESGGTFTDNDLSGNKRGAWDIADGADVTKSGNTE